MTSNPVDSLSYEGGAFHSKLVDGKTSGKLTVSNQSIRFLSDDQKTERSFPLSQIKIGKGGNHLLFVTSAIDPEWTLFTSDFKILKHPTLKAHPTVWTQIKAVQKSSHQIIIAGLLAFALVVGIFYQIFSWRSQFSSWLVTQIPQEWEESLGETTVKAFTYQQAIEDLEIRKEFLKLIGFLTDKQKNLRFRHQFHLNASDTINAFALPGGQIVVLSELILSAQRPEQILGVIAHEMAHVEMRHSLKSMISSMSMTLVMGTVVGDVGPLLETIAGQSARLWTLKYSRDFEREADQQGWQYLIDADIDPAGLIEFFELLKSKGGMELPDAASFASTHPATSERISTLQNWRKGLSRRFEEIPFDLPAFQHRLRQKLKENKK